MSEKMYKISRLGREYMVQSYGAFLRRADAEQEVQDLKKGRVLIDLSKESDWAYMRLNYQKYRRLMNYEVIAYSFDDAVNFMSKVLQKPDHRQYIRITALRMTNKEYDKYRQIKSNLDKFYKLFTELRV